MCSAPPKLKYIPPDILGEIMHRCHSKPLRRLAAACRWARAQASSEGFWRRAFAGEGLPAPLSLRQALPTTPVGWVALRKRERALAARAGDVAKLIGTMKATRLASSWGVRLQLPRDANVVRVLPDAVQTSAEEVGKGAAGGTVCFDVAHAGNEDNHRVVLVVDDRRRLDPELCFYSEPSVTISEGDARRLLAALVAGV